MTTADKCLISLVLWAVAGMVAAGPAAAGPGVAGPGAAQEPVAQPPATAPGTASATQSSAQIDAGEPRANTSTPADRPSADTGPVAAGKSAPSAASRAAKPTPPKVPGAADRLDLGTATVTGDREQPKVMYIVPWKSSDIGDLSGKPMNSLLDEALAPVDREEFKREVVYYQAVRADAAQNAAKSPKQGEK